MAYIFICILKLYRPSDTSTFDSMICVSMSNGFGLAVTLFFGAHTARVYVRSTNHEMSMSPMERKVNERKALNDKNMAFSIILIARVFVFYQF